MNFEEIIQTIGLEDIIRSTEENPNAFSFDDLVNHFQSGQKNESKKLKEFLSPDEQRYNIATYAKLISEHVGFNSFGEENINNFKKEVENLYNNVKDAIDIRSFARQLESPHRFIQDNHCLLYTSLEESHNREEQKEVPEKIPEELSSIEGYHVCNEENTLNEKLCWEIGRIEKDGQNILLVRIPSFGGKRGTYNDWERFIRTFDALYGQSGKIWSKIILDVRGNGGGEDKPIAHIAQRTYGNYVNSYKRCETRDTPIGDYIYKTHGIFGRFCPEDVEVLPRQNFSGENRAIFDQTEKYYPFNEEQGYKGDINILFDGRVGSAAESAHTLFLHHPKTLFIGENTKGMQQYQQGWVNLPCGFGLRVACTKLTYYDQKGENIECIGHEPDIRCKSEEALKIALTTKEAGFKHKLNESPLLSNFCPAPNGVNPYDPEEEEQRKAFSPRFVEPALEKIEFENIINSLSEKDLIVLENPKAKDEVLTLSEQRKMLAFMGRFLYNGHGGFADGNPDIVFPEKVRDDFIHAFLKLYQQETPKTVDEILADIFKLQMKHIPDNHFNVLNSDGSAYQLPAEEEKDFQRELRELLKKDDIDKCQRGKIERYLSVSNQVGTNFANRQELPQNLSDQTSGIQWKTGIVNQNGHKVYVVGISSFAAFDENGKFKKELVDDFTNLAVHLSKQGFQKSDALVIDLRGNRGGWPYIGDYLARTLYGNTVTSGGASLMRDTLERALISAYMKKSSAEEKQEIVNRSFSGKTKEIKGEKWTDTYPFNPELGFNKPVFVLTDRDTGSNSEATCEKLAAHPYVRFIGENTKGCLQFGSAPTGDSALPLPFWGKVSISLGASASDTIQGRYEGIGIAPDYPVKQDALDFVIENFDSISKDIQKDVSNFGFKTDQKPVAVRESYVGNLTQKNVEYMKKTQNDECADAVQRLSNVTEVIPQIMEKIASAEKNNNHSK
ncbi:MAG: hypothetical protein J6Y03_00375 [Alphaproteobacteria bacterium]|nr:hypothetical protein [Alphaproteobacteria bacterium]